MAVYASNVVARLESATSTNVRLHSFRTSYFPPGCVIEGAELRHKNAPGAAPLMTVRSFTIVSSYRQLLFHQRIEVMHLEDARLDMGQRKRLKSTGNFEIVEVTFTKQKTRQGASELSLRAQGQKVPDRNKAELPKITGQISGHVEVLDGVFYRHGPRAPLPQHFFDARATHRHQGKLSRNKKRVGQ